MPLGENQLQLGDLAHSIDWQKASRAIRVLKGRIVVEMLPVPDKVGSLYLPQNNSNIRPDVGAVIAHGGSTVVQKRLVDAPEIGSLVGVRPYDGTWIESADCGPYKPQGQLRVYGAYKNPSDEIVELVPWWDSVVCQIMPDKTLRPLGSNLVFRLDPITETEGGIILSRQSQYRTGMATVEAVGPLIFDVKVGDRVCVDLEKVEHDYLAVDGVVDRDLRVGPDLAINYVLQEEAA